MKKIPLAPNGKPPIKFSAKAKAFKPGVYRHYKGGEYDAIGVAYHGDAETEVVVYRALYEPYTLFVRSLGVFLGRVVHKGEKLPRFKKVKK